mmetsp:Transcript_20445/g.28119  ORF Transcript_20445/g.28119 Transcript_20445/m.28119 type:complete len:136 (+) Transcript_20445:340-747(+)
MLILDGQMKLLQESYDIIDKKITDFDQCTKPLVHLLPQLLDEEGKNSDNIVRKKKKRRENNETQVAESTSFNSAVPVDPNEPVYCTCRQVSYGKMVACENTECAIEWFHYGCVGLKEELKPEDVWYCKECTPSAA